MKTIARKTFGTVAVLSSAFLGANVAAATISFSDDTFSNGDYTQKIYQSSPGIVTSAGQTPTSGNPAPAAWVTYDTNVSPFTILVGLLRPSFSYSPASAGALSSISVSLDRYFAPVTNGNDTPVTDLSPRTLIQQGGQYFQASNPQNGTRAAWVALTASGLTAADFVLYDFTTNTSTPSVHPDFTQDIDAFGFAMRATGAACNFVAGPCQSSGTVGTDNWFLTLTTVPEPGSSLALLALTGLAAVVSRRRMNRA